MFFVVDVETSGLTPFQRGSELLTVAIVPVGHDGYVFTEQANYWRLKHTSPDPRTVPFENRNPTESFWAEQDSYVIDEAYSSFGLRLSAMDFKYELNKWLEEIEPDKNKRFIVANPVAFDKMWLESLYRDDYYDSWPFHYRCLCLRSMRFGLEPSNEYGSSKGAQESSVPHHAFEDAIAEAYDLRDLIAQKGKLWEFHPIGDDHNKIVEVDSFPPPIYTRIVRWQFLTR